MKTILPQSARYTLASPHRAYVVPAHPPRITLTQRQMLIAARRDNGAWFRCSHCGLDMPQTIENGADGRGLPVCEWCATSRPAFTHRFFTK